MAQNLSDNPISIPQADLVGPVTELVPAPLDVVHSNGNTVTPRNLHGNPELDQADVVSTINVQAWFNHTPWRITAGWSAVASLFATGILTSLFDWRAFLGWQTIVLTILLVDPLWGNIWRFAWGREGVLPLGKMQQAYRFWLPYLQPNSPAGRLMGVYQPKEEKRLAMHGPRTDGSENLGQNAAVDLAPLLFRTALPTILLALGIAATLGASALWFTALAIVCTMLGWLARQSWGKPAALLQALVFVALPWALMTSLVQANATGSVADISYTAIGEGGRGFYSLLLAGLWTIHCWGIMLARRSASASAVRPGFSQHGGPSDELASWSQPGTDVSTWQGHQIESSFITRIQSLISAPAFILLLAADVGMAILFLALREPLWLAILVPLWLPVWLGYLQNGPVDRQPIWRLLAMLISAVAVGQTLVV